MLNGTVQVTYYPSVHYMQVVLGDAALQGVDGFAESAGQDVDERLPEVPEEINVSLKDL